VFTGAEKTKGYWDGLYFDQNSDGSLLESVKVEYGGRYDNNIYLNYASVDIKNSTITDSDGYGIYSTGDGDNVNILNNEISDNDNYGIYTAGSGTVTIEKNQIQGNGYGVYLDGSSYSSLIVNDNSFTGNGNYPLTVSAAYIDDVKDNTFTTNTPNEIQLLTGTISTDSTMRNPGTAYHVSEYVYVYNSVTTPTLTIEPGVTVEFDQYIGMYIGSGE
jgi:parallel beta-helix repeat protein